MTSQQIIDFADNLERESYKRKRSTKSPRLQRDLYVPLERMKDLLTFKEILEKKMAKGSIEFLNRKAITQEVKAIKMPGTKEWLALPEWIEEYNNSWVISNVKDL
jgi:hypothetical protein